MSKTLGIIIATYNQGDYILRALVYSLLCQTNNNFKAYVIHDGPSTDSTGFFMSQICINYPNNFRYIELVERGNCWGHNCRNFGLSICEEPFIHFTNGDNIYTKDFVRQVTHTAITYNPDIITSPILHSYFDYQVFSGHEFNICRTDFANFTVKTDLAKQIKFKESEIAADGHFMLDFRLKFPNFTQHKINAVLGVHQ
jgi:glycosyltransferase involved in cell wall biosynthesis